MPRALAKPAVGQVHSVLDLMLIFCGPTYSLPGPLPSLCASGQTYKPAVTGWVEDFLGLPSRIAIIAGMLSCRVAGRRLLSAAAARELPWPGQASMVYMILRRHRQPREALFELLCTCLWLGYLLVIFVVKK